MPLAPHSHLWQPKMSPDITKCPLGGKIPVPFLQPHLVPLRTRVGPDVKLGLPMPRTGRLFPLHSTGRGAQCTWGRCGQPGQGQALGAGVNLALIPPTRDLGSPSVGLQRDTSDKITQTIEGLYHKEEQRSQMQDGPTKQNHGRCQAPQDHQVGGIGELMGEKQRFSPKSKSTQRRPLRSQWSDGPDGEGVGSHRWGQAALHWGLELHQWLRWLGPSYLFPRK